MEKIERLKRERAELDKRIETLEYAERMFEEGDEIYHVDEYGNVNSGKWGGLMVHSVKDISSELKKKLKRNQREETY